jgi:pyruvate carboxylase
MGLENMHFFGKKHDNIVHLNECDCNVQRWYQKIIKMALIISFWTLKWQVLVPYWPIG